MSERNGVPVSDSRPRRRFERLPDGIAPAQRVAAVVDLVEDHERARGLRELAVRRRAHGDLGVGHHDPR